MVTQYGMSRKFGMMGLETVESRYLDGRAILNCSDATGAEIDTEVRGILDGCYNAAKELLAANRQALTEISAFLAEKETITGDVFMEILKGM
jgi:cell division protease FtsH